jgi:hypothetical protein
MSFSQLMQSYCRQAGWSIADQSETKVRIAFNMPSGRTQTVYILAFGDTVEFSVQSALYFDDEVSIPHNISTDLMRKSCTNKVGMWVLESIQGKFVYSLMHNCAIEHLTFQEFERNVEYLIGGVDKFEHAIQALVGNGSNGHSNIESEFGRGLARGAGQKLGFIAVGALLSLLAS